jgi:hypothetical protein
MKKGADMTPPIPPGIGEWSQAQRETYLLGLVLADPDLTDADVTFLLTRLQTETSDPARSAMVFLVGSHIDEEEVRHAVENISDDLNGQSATRDALLELVVSARFDELEEVRFWGRDRLKAMEGIDSEDAAQFGPFLQKLLRDETGPDGLRKLAARGLAWLGERPGLLELVELGETAATDAEKTDWEKDQDSERRWLLETIIDALGEAPDALAENGLLRRSRELIGRGQEIFSSENRAIQEAGRRIGKIPSPETATKPADSSTASSETGSARKTSNAKTRWADIFRSWFRSPFIIGAAVAAGAAAIALPWLFQAEAPEFQNLVLTGITREGRILQTGPSVRTRGPSGGDIVLRSGEHISISLTPKDDGFFTVVLLDSQKITSVLFSDRVSAGERVRLPESEEKLGYRLDKNTGMETILVIASANPIPGDQLSKGLERIRREGADAARSVFPDSNVEILPFHHE